MAISFETLALCKKAIAEAGGFTAGDLTQIHEALDALTEDVTNKADALEYDSTSGELKLKAGENALSTIKLVAESHDLADDTEVDNMLDGLLGEN